MTRVTFNVSAFVLSVVELPSGQYLVAVYGRSADAPDHIVERNVQVLLADQRGDKHQVRSPQTMPFRRKKLLSVVCFCRRSWSLRHRRRRPRRSERHPSTACLNSLVSQFPGIITSPIQEEKAMTHACVHLSAAATLVL